MPRDDGKLVLSDLVRGTVEFAWREEADHVVQRADGSFIYHLANVVDDRDFGITHVIRAEEHLSNTPRQVFIAQALGYPAARVRPPALRRRARVQAQAVQAQAGRLPEEPGLRQGAPARDRDRRRDEPADHARDLQPGRRRFLRAGRLPARRGRQLPGAARLVAGRQDRVHVARPDDRKLRARAREPVARPASIRPSCSRSSSSTCAGCRSPTRSRA